MFEWKKPSVVNKGALGLKFPLFMSTFSTVGLLLVSFSFSLIDYFIDTWINKEEDSMLRGV